MIETAWIADRDGPDRAGRELGLVKLFLDVRSKK